MSVLKNGLYNTAAGIVRMGLATLTIPLLIHLIGIEEYGLWTLVSAIVGIVTLAEAGLSTATTVFVSQDLGQEDRDGLSQTLTATLGAMLILATLAAISLWISSASMVNWFSNLKQTQQITAIQTLRIGSWVVWTRLLQQILVGVEQAYQRYGTLSLLNTAQGILLNLGLLAVAWSGGRTIALMQWQAVISILSLGIHSWFVQSLLQKMRLNLDWNWEKGLAVGQYSLMVWLSSLGGALFTRCDRLIVGNVLGTSVLGVYAAITDVTLQVNSFSALPVQPLLPSLSYLVTAQGFERAKLQKQLKQALQINAVTAFGLGAMLITLSPFILSLLFNGASFQQYEVPFRVVASAYALYSMNAVGYYLLLSTHAMKTCAWIQLIAGFLSLSMIAIGAYFFGLIGAMIGNFGYLLIFFQTVVGMKNLSIPKSEWMRWLYFPFAWFCSVLITNTLLPSQASEIVVISLFVGQNVVILWWFLHQNRYLVSPLTSS